MRRSFARRDLSLALSAPGLRPLLRFCLFCAVAFTVCAGASPYLFHLDPVLTVLGFPFWVLGSILMGWSAAATIRLLAARRPAIAETPTGLQFNNPWHSVRVRWEEILSVDLRGYGKSMNIEVGLLGRPPLRFPVFLVGNSDGEVESWIRDVRARLASG